MAVRIVETIKKGRSTHAHLDGFLYVISYRKGDTSYWKCKRKDQCPARLITKNAGQNLHYRDGGRNHSHLANPEEVEAIRTMSAIKRAAMEHPEVPPSRTIRILNDVDDAVSSLLPHRQNILKVIRRERLRYLPTNPTSILELREIPEQLKKSKTSENFLIYDSYEDESYNLTCGRIIIFATRSNLEQLFQCEIWFVDGTFSTVPSIFFQMYVIMGSVTQNYKGKERKFALPFVYALMESMKEQAYKKVLEVILSKADDLGIRIQHPRIVLSDFELAIINSIRNTFSENIVRLCLFHLCQSVFRRIQSEGLQQRYNDNNDRSIRNAARSLCALAFVPVDDVTTVFDELHNDMPEEFLVVGDYFELIYVRGKRAQGRRRAVPVRYAPHLWNQFETVLQGTVRTNNASEGWHNKFQVVMGRKHPSLYAFLKELQSEQGDTDAILRDMCQGKRVKYNLKKNLQDYEDRIFNIVRNYEE